MVRVAWKDSPDAHDYPAAAEYLSLLVADPAIRADLVSQWERAAIGYHKAKDLLRASQLPMLPQDNLHVAADLRKIRKGRALSPLLLVRGDLLRGFPLQIADGYHRACASYYVNEDTNIPCRLIDIPMGATGPGAAPKTLTRDADVPPPKAPATKAPAKKAAAKKAPAKKAAATT